MKIILAKKAGFCMGVRRAMEIVVQAIDERKGKIYTHGPLIHNPQALEALESKDVVMMPEKLPPPSSRVIIRAHGVPPEELKEIEEAGLSICDATCPRVKRVQRIIRDYVGRGYFIVIVGDKGHAEVLGLMGYAGDGVRVIETASEVDQLPRQEKFCVVAQTTQSESHYRKVTEKLKQVFPDTVIHNTLCYSTSERQEEARALARKVDAVVVVGGKESANTNRLTELIAKEGTPVFQVETEKELDESRLAVFHSVGVTAGASTPNWMIRKVISRLENIRISTFPFPLKEFIRFSVLLIKSNIYVAIGAAFLVYTCCLLQNITPRLPFMVIASLYVFSMHVFHYLTKGKELQFEEPSRGEFFEKYRNALLALSLLCIIGSLIIAYTIGPRPFWLLLFATILGIIYNIRIMPGRYFKFLSFQRLRDIPASKDVFMALAWAAITVVLPAIAEGPMILSESLVVIFFVVFVLVYNRSILFDIKEIHGDKMVGKETMPIFIGKQKTKVVLVFLLFLAMLGLVLSTYRGHLPAFGYILIVILLYNAVYLYLYHRRIITHGMLCEFVVDGKFLLAGILSFLYELKI